MAWTQAELDALRSAYSKGQRSISYGDKKVEYASLDEMARAIDRIAAAVEGTTARGKRKIIVASNKGLG